jgi:hypothetical protein
MRRTIATILVVIAAILAFVALLAIWVNRQALNTDNWTKTSTELLEQPVIRHQVAARLTDQLFASVDVAQAFRDVLPDRADVLAAPAANALRTQVEKRANIALERPDVQQLWANANRTAHEQLLSVLNGGGSTVATQNGEVVLDVKQLLAELQQQVGVGGRLRKVLPASATQIKLFNSSELKTAQNGVKVLRPLPVILLLISLALVAAAMFVAPHWRRRAIRAYGIGFVLAGLGALLARSLGGDAFVSSLAKTAAAEPPLQELWTISTQMLADVATATIAYGIVMVFAAWLAGPTRWAVSVRRLIAPYWREPAIAYSVLALVVAILIWWAPSPAWRNVPLTLILVALLALGTEALRRQVIREFPAATREDAAGRYRERWAVFMASSRRRGDSLRSAGSRAAQSASGAITSTRTAASGGGGESVEDARLQQLERLAQLRQAGILDDDELKAEKARILNSSDTVAAN